MKNKLYLFIAGCWALVLSSCLDSGGLDREYEVDRDCQITSFSLQSDSVSGLDEVKFTIDQVNGRIMNLDSMPYGTEIEKVVCTVSIGSYVGRIEVFQQATGDTLDWNQKDSLDFSQPVRFVTSSTDRTVSKEYLAYVNIHQVVPDSLPWSLYTDEMIGQTMVEQRVIPYSDGETDYYYMYMRPTSQGAYHLYRSAEADAKEWSEITLSGLPESGVDLAQITRFEDKMYVPATDGSLYESPDGSEWTRVTETPEVVSLLGSMRPNVNQPARLSAIIRYEGVLQFAAMMTDGEWQVGAEVPTDFPIAGFASLPISLMYRERILIVGGRASNDALQNISWATMDALTWAKMTDSQSHYFSARAGSMMAYYDDKYYLIGGIDENGTPLKDIYTSTDYGVTWKLQDEMVILPAEYQARGYASMLVDADNFLLIFGGKTNETGSFLDEIWKGRINRLGFERQ